MKTVVITGSTRGLGFEMARAFRQHDYNIVINGTNDVGITNAIEKLKKIEGKGEIVGRKCNVTSRKEVEELAQKAVDSFGRIDIWINNAGANQTFAYAWEIESDEVDFLLDVDLKGTIHGTTVAMNQMINQGSGAIYNVEGMGSNDAFQSCFALYGTAKRAVTYYTDAVSKEAAEKQLPVLVGKLSPGIMITDFLTSAKGQKQVTSLDDKTKKVYNILGDYPDIIADFLVEKIISNTKNGVRFNWLTGGKAAKRFLTASFNKRDFFE